jgi:hypothetical protein
MALTLPVKQWPPADRQVWTALFAQGGPLDDCGALAHVRHTTWVSLEWRYG